MKENRNNTVKISGVRYGWFKHGLTKSQAIKIKQIILAHDFESFMDYYWEQNFQYGQPILPPFGGILNAKGKFVGTIDITNKKNFKLIIETEWLD